MKVCLSISVKAVFNKENCSLKMVVITFFFFPGMVNDLGFLAVFFFFFDVAPILHAASLFGNNA